MLPAICPTVLSRTTGSVTKPAETVVDSERTARLDEVLPFFSTDLIRLVAEYDSVLALQPLRVDRYGIAIQSEENRNIWSAVREALTSVQADPRINRQIIINALLHRYERKFNKLVTVLESNRIRINLNHVDLSNLRLKEIRFSLASAVNINFSGSVLDDVSLSGADLARANLTDTTLRNVFLVNADLTGAQFNRTCFVRCYATNLTTNDRHLKNLAYLTGSGLCLDGMHTAQRSHFQIQPMPLTAPPSFFDPSCLLG